MRSLRHYIGAPKSSCANGDADQIRSANYQLYLISRIFSCSGRISIYAPNIRCANKLARCNYENFVWSASPNYKLIAYSFCWSERKRKYVLHWQMACSKWKWTSIDTVPDLCPTAVKILTHLISRYHLPLSPLSAVPYTCRCISQCVFNTNIYKIKGLVAVRHSFSFSYSLTYSFILLHSPRSSEILHCCRSVNIALHMVPGRVQWF